MNNNVNFIEWIIVHIDPDVTQVQYILLTILLFWYVFVDKMTSVNLYIYLSKLSKNVF